MPEQPRPLPEYQNGLEFDEKGLELVVKALGPAAVGFLQLPDAPERFLAAFGTMSAVKQASLIGRFGLDGREPVLPYAALGRSLVAEGLVDSTQEPGRMVQQGVQEGQRSLLLKLAKRLNVVVHDFDYATFEELAHGRDLYSELVRLLPEAWAGVSRERVLWLVEENVASHRFCERDRLVFCLFYGLMGHELTLQKTQIVERLKQAGIEIKNVSYVNIITQHVLSSLVRGFQGVDPKSIA